MGNPYFEPDVRTRQVRIRFSSTELLHIGAAVAVLTVAFTLVLANVPGVAPTDALARFRAPWDLYVASFVAVSSGFVLHELGHKALAQHYGHWAEFRGQFSGLMMSLAMAAGIGFLFAAPGAVMIWGRVTARENGLISLMGPGINIIIAVLAIPFTFARDVDAFLPKTMAVVAVVNAVLAIFNLLPILNLDGRKIWFWNKPVYILSMGLALGLGLLLYMLDITP